ncbi:MAG: hypothetical protein PHN45_01970 [Methylococcales bacterium]|nr:hypothetical protein [Methylococcales bacterium]
MAQDGDNLVYNPQFYDGRYNSTINELVQHSVPMVFTFCCKLQEGVNVHAARCKALNDPTFNRQMLRSFVSSNGFDKITDDRLVSEISKTISRSYDDMQHLLQLAVQSYAMYLAICNSRKTKFNINVPSYANFMRSVLVAFVSRSVETDLKTVVNDSKQVQNEIDSIMRNIITSLVPLDNLIKSDFDTVSIIGDARDSDLLGTAEPVTDDIFEGNALESLQKSIHEPYEPVTDEQPAEPTPEPKKEKTTVILSDLSVDELSKLFKNVEPHDLKTVLSYDQWKHGHDPSEDENDEENEETVEIEPLVLPHVEVV